MKKNHLIFHPLFLLSLFTLLLNDFYLKQTFSNWWTGKLSDFAGLIVFAVFIASIIPSSKKWISLITAVLFIIWKTPAVTPVIEFINLRTLFTVQRIIDYSDYYALLVLPFVHKLINNDNVKISGKNLILKFTRVALGTVSFFAICATSIARVEVPKGTVYIGKKYTIKKSKEEIVTMIRSLGYNVDYYDNKDSTDQRYRPLKMDYYQTNNIIIYDDHSHAIDTLLNVKYTIHELNQKKTRVEIINVTLSEDGNIQQWQTLKFLSKQYRKALEKLMIKKIN